MRNCRAFSLIEMLVVTAVLAVVLVLVTPAFNAITSASKIGQGGSLLLDELDAARQLADVRGRTIEVRVLKAAGASSFTGIQLWWPGSPDSPASRPLALPEGIAIHETLSPWLAIMADGTMPAGGPWGGADYRAFRLRPSGMFEPLPKVADRKRLFLTIAADRDAGGIPANYATVQVNPDTARPLIYRP